MRQLITTRTLIGLSLLSVIAGCQHISPTSIKDTAAPQLPPANLPLRVAGEYFVFDNGTRYTVTRVSGQTVYWKTNNGTESIATANFIIPEFNWTSGSRKSSGTTNADPKTLWPLRVGNTAKFNIQQTIRRNGEATPTELIRNWECNVSNTQAVQVKAGTFETFVIQCDRHSNTDGRVRATRIYYYAPEVGHYVLREDKYRSRENTRRELVRTGFNSNYLSKGEQGQLKRALTKSLEKRTNGFATTWLDRSRRITALLVPTNSYRDESNRQCKEYKSVYSVNGFIRNNARNVCQDSKTKEWVRVD